MEGSLGFAKRDGDSSFKFVVLIQVTATNSVIRANFFKDESADIEALVAREEKKTT